VSALLIYHWGNKSFPIQRQRDASGDGILKTQCNAKVNEIYDSARENTRVFFPDFMTFLLFFTEHSHLSWKIHFPHYISLPGKKCTNNKNKKVNKFLPNTLK